MFDKTKQNNAWRDVCVYLSRTFVAQRFNLAKPFLSLFYFYENATTTHEATTNGTTEIVAVDTRSPPRRRVISNSRTRLEIISFSVTNGTHDARHDDDVVHPGDGGGRWVDNRP